MKKKCPTLGQQTLESQEDKKTSFAAHWALIPLTRAMDTLVLQIKSKDTFMGNILHQIYEQSQGENNPINIQWIKSE